MGGIIRTLGMDIKNIQRGTVVKVKGFSGVACRFVGWQRVLYRDEYGDCEEEMTGRALVIMVGDDHRHVVDPEDMELIAEDSYCDGCGQIGCGHGSNRED